MAAHWTCRLAVALLLLIGLTGCPGDDPLEGCAAPLPPPDSGPPNPGFVRTGEPARVFARPITFQVCAAGESNDPSSATAEVTGPGGEPLAAQVVKLGTSRTLTTVQFTPVQPGPHHVLIEFAPRGGIHQLDVQAAMDRSAEAPTQYLSQVCTSLDRTLQGAWVCDSSVVGGSEPLGSFSGARLAVAGDVIWVVDGSSIRRYVDTGTELTLTGTASRPFGGIDFLLASPNELAVLLSGSLTLYTFQGGVVSSGPATPWIRPSSPIMPESPYGVLLRDGGHLAIATRVGGDAVIDVCPYQLLSGKFERTAANCQRFAGEIIGFEPGALWTRDLPRTTAGGLTNPVQLRRWVWSGGQLTEQGSMSLGLHVIVSDQPRMHSAVVPIVHNVHPLDGVPSPPSSGFPLISAVPAWSPQRKALILEHLDAEMSNGYASPELYWALAPPSAPQPTKVRLRPPTP